MILILCKTNIKNCKNNKKSFSLFEIIISITILFIILYTSTNVIQILNISNNKQERLIKAKIDIESLRLFLINKIKIDKTLKYLRYENNNVYYDGALLLKEVIEFSKGNKTKFITISICLNTKNTLCQTLSLK